MAANPRRASLTVPAAAVNREIAGMPECAGMSLEHEDGGLVTLRGQPDRSMIKPDKV